MAYNAEIKPGETLEQYYRRLAKVADQRLVRLEQLKGQENYENAWKWAYQRAQKDIEKWSGTDAKRFNVAPPKDKGQLKAKINDIKAFLGSQTSTKQGITKVYQKRANTFNKKYGTNLSWEDLAEYYGKKINEKLEAKMASEVANKAIAVISSQIKQGAKLEDLQHLARLRKDGGHQFGYTKSNGEQGQYDMIVDDAVHKILRSKGMTEELYSFLRG